MEQGQERPITKRVGASLLAIAKYQAPQMLNVPASSRAGSFPQRLQSVSTFFCPKERRTP
ncbi:hypothetical protein C1X29_20415 [Pseudomonas sp. GW456-12-10-14-LB2]|nr:hypothetical protein C1X29_20415 [Pseudomonas sp. GW456-12-10-14-LB2]